MAHEINKELWKNIHFENMTAAFLLRCQNWPRWEISSLKYWFKKAKNVFRSNYGPKKWPKYHLKTILTTFSERNKCFWAILVKINFCHAWFQGYFTKVGFDTSEENQLSYFQNGCFFKILWWFHEPYNEIECR